MILLLNFSNPVLETIWADFVLKNPLQVDVELMDLTVVVREAGETQSDEAQEGLVEVEVIDRISLAPGEQRTVWMFSGFRFPRSSLAHSPNTRSRCPSSPFDQQN